MGKNYKWKLLKEFLNERYNEPKKMPGYVFYFFFVIIFVGSFGLIYDLFSTTYGYTLEWDKERVRNIVMNMTNISLSLVTASIIDLIFISKNSLRRDEGNEDFLKIKRDINILGISFLITVFLLWILANAIFINVYIKLFLGSTSLIFGYYVWWISNSKNKILVQNNNVNHILGNSPDNSENGGLQGDIKGFKK